VGESGGFEVRGCRPLASSGNLGVDGASSRSLCEFHHRERREDSHEKKENTREMVLCEGIIANAQNTGNAFGQGIADDTKHVGELRCNLMYKLFDKVKTLSKKTYEQIACEFFDKVKILGSAAQVGKKRLLTHGMTSPRPKSMPRSR
jgi:hypothetical protein